MGLSKTSVLLVDDDPIVRAGLRMILSADPTVSVVGEASDGGDALTRIREAGPDVVLMDLQMPVMDGVHATRAIRREAKAPAVLILTTFHLDHYVIDALNAGASGYLLKETPPTEIARAVHLAAAGESVFSAAVTERLVRRIDGPADTSDERGRAQAALADLTEREREVAESVAEGKSNSAIARQVFMSEATVKTHVSRILAKTGKDNRVQIALLIYNARGSPHTD
jgi:DNA-binding NarL/FixJ family response regulator